MTQKYKGIENRNIVAIFLVLIIMNLCECDEKICDRRPLGTKSDPLPPDDRFRIEIIGIIDSLYIPNSQYTVRLHSTDKTSTFIAFTISVREDTKANEKNPRKPLLLNPGIIYPSPDSDTIPSHVCNNSVIQSDITPKKSVQAIWRAPPKDNKCVTIYAVLAVKPDVWYNFEGPLSKRVCEDRRNAEDMQPIINDDCQVCEDAKYLLTFEGIWSFNTHPQVFPNSSEIARFSDVVGASHSKNFNVFKLYSDASQGLKMLAEQGNTTKLEMEIQAKLQTSVRTVIKASSQPRPDMTTTAMFRATQVHHLLSLVAAIIPSPDWFLGVANMELCDVKTNNWAPHLTLNIYPLDAGTDSGLTFESSNEETMPPQPISNANITKNIPKEDLRPFAKLRLDLMRTFPRPGCVTESPPFSIRTLTDESDNSNEIPNQPQVTPSTEEEVPTADPNSSPDCPMTAWEDWLPCEGECVNNKLEGYQTRFRYHMVDGVIVGKYVESESPVEDKEVPQFCIDNYPDSETQKCEELCEDPAQVEDEAQAQGRLYYNSD
ncbi:spondin-2-like [Aricia agestis]|uniref:spondin-2-like n=1 Tax=Aricia agestis TaxID=91739 RepID=UPI001C204C98|nr:spondin-2-like [Aricia agestis]